MSNTLFSEQHLKQMLKAAKEGARVAFAFGEDDGGKGTIIADVELASDQLLAKLKSKVHPERSTHGQLAVEGGKLVLSPAKSYKDLKKRVAAWLEASGLSYGSVAVRDAEGAEESDLSSERRQVVTNIGYALNGLLKKDHLVLTQVPKEFHEAFKQLETAKDDKNTDGEARAKAFEQGVRGLAPVLKLDGWDRAMVQWMETNLLAPLKELRRTVEDARATARIDALVENPEALAMAEDRTTRRDRLKKLAEDADKIMGLLGPAVSGQTSAGDRAEIKVRAGGVDVSLASIDIATDALKVGSALLALSDEELNKKLAQAGAGHPMLKNVRTVAELEKALLDLASGVTGVLAKTATLAATLKGNLELAAKIEAFGGVIGKPLNAVCGLVSVVQGVAVWLDADSTAQENLDATVNVAGGTLGMGTTAAEMIAAGTADVALKASATTVAGGLAAAGAVLVATYALAKLSADLFWQSRSGLMSTWAKLAFNTLDRAAERIARDLKKGAATCALLEAEQSDAQIAALSKALNTIQGDLGSAVNGLLTLCSEGGLSAEAANPSSYPVFKEKFAPLLRYKGEKNPAKLVRNAGRVLDAISWCFTNSDKVLKAAAAGKGVDAVEALIEAEKKAAG